MPAAKSVRYGLWIGALTSVLVLLGCGQGDGGGTNPDDGGGTDTSSTPHVRPEIHSLSPEQVEAYRQGVALMKKRGEEDPTDPTSWIYQANIHGVPTNDDICAVTPVPPQEGWSSCQHGTFFFLPWHRMYLYYFERILRAAVREAVGDPEYEFNLPYWDYENPAFHALPEPYRLPADDSNSLFVSQRAEDCNNGSVCVSEQEASAEVALSRLPFCNCESAVDCPEGTAELPGCVPGLLPDETFGGQYTPVPEHGARDFGELESQPHNVVHDAIGGGSGWMSFVECAARDPIFWNHHANIDRLWQVWLNQGNRFNPLGVENWRHHEFVFFDENGDPVNLTGCEILNMATQLDYVYPDLPVENVVLCEDSPAAPATTTGQDTRVEYKVLATSEKGAVALGREPAKVSVAVPDLPPEARIADDSPRLRVVVEGLRIIRPGGIFQVYLNLPDGEVPDPKGLHYLGHIAIFGHIHDGQATGQRSFDITDQVRALQADGEWSGRVELTIVHSNPEDGASAAENAREFLSFSHISVVER